jgi:predicted enzyme related to lactoylglutathione lyase
MIATCDFLENVLGLEREWQDEQKQITMYRLESGQEIEVFAASNRSRKEKYRYYNGPVIGLTVDNIETAREELEVQGAEFVDPIDELEGGSVRWTHFWTPDGQFYSLHQFEG